MVSILLFHHFTFNMLTLNITVVTLIYLLVAFSFLTLCTLNIFVSIISFHLVVSWA